MSDETYACEPGSARLTEDSCFECPPGSYSHGGLQQLCTNVPKGYYTPFFNASRYDECEYAEYTGAAICQEENSICSKGYYFYDDSCQPAPAGYYVPMEGSGIYYACPPGSYAPSSGASACIIIPEKHYGPFTAAVEAYDTCSSAVETGAVNCVEEGFYYAPVNAITLVNHTVGLKSPSDAALTSTGIIYLTDTGNNLIRRITTSGAMNVFAGWTTSGTVDGSGTVARFYRPTGIAIDDSGIIFVVDTGNHRIRKITSSGRVATFVGSSGGYFDATGTAAMLYQPYGIALDINGNAYVSDNDAVIRYIDTAGKVTTIAGSPLLNTTYCDGYGTNAQFNLPRDLDIDIVGNVYIVDLGNQRIRRLELNGLVRTIAGSGSPAWEDGVGTYAGLNYPIGIVVDTNSVIYFTSTGYGIVRQMETNGVITSLAGSISSVPFQDGIGTTATFEGPTGMSVDTNGNLYVVGNTENTLRSILVHNTSCPGGQYYNGHFCINAPAGYHIPFEPIEDVLYACGAGWYSQESAIECSMVPAGNFTPSPGQPMYFPCPNNTYDIAGLGECLDLSVQPTSFPTGEPIVRVHTNPFLVVIILSILFSCLVVCVVLGICYYKCWRDDAEEHKLHAHRHDEEFGVEGNTTIQMHAVSDYVSIRQQHAEQDEETKDPAQRDRLSNVKNKDETRGNADGHRQVVTVALAPREGHKPLGRLPPPANPEALRHPVASYNSNNNSMNSNIDRRQIQPRNSQHPQRSHANAYNSHF